MKTHSLLSRLSLLTGMLSVVFFTHASAQVTNAPATPSEPPPGMNQATASAPAAQSAPAGTTPYNSGGNVPAVANPPAQEQSMPRVTTPAPAINTAPPSINTTMNPTPMPSAPHINTTPSSTTSAPPPIDTPSSAHSAIPAITAPTAAAGTHH